MKLNKYAILGVLAVLTMPFQAEAGPTVSKKRFDFVMGVLEKFTNLPQLVASKEFEAFAQERKVSKEQLALIGLVPLQEQPEVSVTHIKMVDPKAWDPYANAWVASRTLSDFYVLTLSDGRKIAGYAMLNLLKATVGEDAADFADLTTKNAAVKDGAPAMPITFKYDPSKSFDVNLIDVGGEAQFVAALDLMKKEGCTAYYGAAPKDAKWKVNVDVRAMLDTEHFFAPVKKDETVKKD